METTTNLTLEGESDAIRALVTQGDASHWEMGQHYNNIVDNKLAEAQHYKSAHDYIAAHVTEIPQPTLSLYASVARKYTEAVAKELGCTKLGLLITYLGVTHQEPPEDPRQEPITLPDAHGGTVTKTFVACSRTEMQAALRHLKAPPSDLPAPDAAKVQRLQAALDEVLGAHSKARVRAIQGHGGTELTLEHVPLDMLGPVLNALAAA